MRKVIVTGKTRVFERFFKIDEAEVSYERSDGQMSPPRKLLVFERGDSVAALVYNRVTKNLVFTKQFRYPTYEKGPGWLVEVMAGTIEGSDTPVQTLDREIVEELGYKAETYSHIATFYVSPGGSSERIHLFYVEVSERVAAGGGLEEEGEDIEFVEVPPADLMSTFESCQDAKTLIALQWALRRLSRHNDAALPDPP